MCCPTYGWRKTQSRSSPTLHQQYVLLRVHVCISAHRIYVSSSLVCLVIKFMHWRFVALGRVWVVASRDMARSYSGVKKIVLLFARMFEFASVRWAAARVGAHSCWSPPRSGLKNCRGLAHPSLQQRQTAAASDYSLRL